MTKWTHLLILIFCLGGAVIVWWYYHVPQHAETAYSANRPPLTNEPISPIPPSVDLDGRKVELGERLFNDPVLSHDDSVSCATCHSLTKGGTDQLTRSIGIGGHSGSINAPTVFNSSYNFKQFWDGRAETLEDQIDGPTQAAQEMGSNWAEIINKLSQSARYVGDFGKIYADGIQRDNVKDAIATFERSLITPNSRFDQYLLGNRDALTTEEKQGYYLFKEYGCASCHQGVNIGGNLFQKFGVMSSRSDAGSNATKADLGRFNVTGQEADKFVFKVPSLRNVALTAPYFHDGSVTQLDQAVTIMSVTQLGRPLTVAETAAIVKFLKSLSGEYKGRAL